MASRRPSKPDAFERAREELLGLDPKEFTARRDALSRELTQAGDPTAARRVKALRKPSVTVGAVNRLARSEPRAVSRLLAAGARLAGAQQEALAGRGADALRESQRGFLDELSRASRTAAERAGISSPTQLQKIQQTMQAAATGDDALRDALARGVLEEDLAPSGFGGLAGFAGPLPARAAPPRAVPAARAPRSKKAVEPAPVPRGPPPAELKRRAQALRSAEAERRRASERLERAKAEARESAEEAREAEEQARRAEQRSRAARARADAAERALFELNRVVADAERQVADAKADLERP